MLSRLLTGFMKWGPGRHLCETWPRPISAQFRGPTAQKSVCRRDAKLGRGGSFDVGLRQHHK